jgi:hypothetical protein
MQLAIADQKHDAGCGELLGEGCEPEICFGIEGTVRAEVADSITLAEDRFAVVDNENGGTRGITGF